MLDEQGKPVFKIYGQAKSVASNQIILLLRKGKQNNDGFHVIPVDANFESFGGASFLFFNTSNLPFAADIGDKKFTLNPGEQRIVKPKPDHLPHNCQATFYYMPPDKDEWKRFYDTRWPANESTRTMVFFYRLPGTDRVGVAPVIEIIRKYKPDAR